MGCLHSKNRLRFKRKRRNRVEPLGDDDDVPYGHDPGPPPDTGQSHSRTQILEVR